VHVRVAPRDRCRVLTVVLLLASALTGGSVACRREADPSNNIRVSWALDPSPPVSGAPMVVTLTLRDSAQRPVVGAHLRLEGVMSHPGMAPVSAMLMERGDGRYDAQMQFTMAGDWTLLVTGELPGGAPLKKQIDIAGVRAAS